MGRARLVSDTDYGICQSCFQLVNMVNIGVGSTHYLIFFCVHIAKMVQIDLRPIDGRRDAIYRV